MLEVGAFYRPVSMCKLNYNGIPKILNGQIGHSK